MTNLLSNNLNFAVDGINRLADDTIENTDLLIWTNRQRKHISVVNGLIYIWWDDSSKYDREFSSFTLRYCTADGASGYYQGKRGQSFEDLLAESKARWAKNFLADADSTEDRENIAREMAVRNGNLEEVEKDIADHHLAAEIWQAEIAAYKEAEQRAYDALQIGSVIKTNLTTNNHVVQTQEEIDALHEWVVIAKDCYRTVTVKNLKKLDLVGTRERRLPFDHILCTGKVVEVK